MQTCSLQSISEFFRHAGVHARRWAECAGFDAIIAEQSLVAKTCRLTLAEVRDTSRERARAGCP